MECLFKVTYYFERQPALASKGFINANDVINQLLVVVVIDSFKFIRIIINQLHYLWLQKKTNDLNLVIDWYFGYL